MVSIVKMRLIFVQQQAAAGLNSFLQAASFLYFPTPIDSLLTAGSGSGSFWIKLLAIYRHIEFTGYYYFPTTPPQRNITYDITSLWCLKKEIFNVVMAFSITPFLLNFSINVRSNTQTRFNVSLVVAEGFPFFIMIIWTLWQNFELQSIYIFWKRGLHHLFP